jgi:hypothetical protein
MISARRFSLQGSVWRQHAPMMEQVVRWINSHEVVFGRPVRVSQHANRNGIVAETAFRRAAVNAPLFERDEEAESEARRLLALLPRGQFADAELAETERLEASLIQQNIARYAATLQEVRYFHPVPGCGVVDAAVGDLIHAGGIAEIKAVERAFRGTDLRQVLIYATMKYASGSTVDEISLYNPRRARLFSSTLDDIAFGVSGRSAVELVQDLVDAMVGFQISA